MTLFLAIWGAAIGTLAFVWHIVEWYQARPQIVATIEAIESFQKDDAFAAIRLTLRNRGGKKTTVEEIFFYQKLNWFEHGLWSVVSRLKENANWIYHVSANQETAKLPTVLDVHGVWKGFITLEASDTEDEKELNTVDRNRDLARKLKAGKLRYSIQCAHTDKRIRGAIAFENFDLQG
jgi:hypothetical protein